MKNQFKIRKEILILLISVFFASCVSNVEDEDMIENEVVTVDPCKDITFAKSVKPIIDTNCIECHGSGGNSPNLTSYNSISASANIVRSAVASRRMPQGGSLTQAEIDAIVCWVENGALDN
ncbi:c-type cytochrome [Polaribacter sp. L3A8]|uniref:c-type cytochrome n=1 Tax=Polaribacter sp. L3A8 TaxID=2686361 RepID=UPI00131B26CC|nr:cytochrome c [Polaribacter sp. L3A8]